MEYEYIYSFQKWIITVEFRDSFLFYFYSQLSGIVPPPVYRNAYLNALGGDGSSKPNAHATIQAPRRKFMDEGKLRKVSFCFNHSLSFFNFLCYISPELRIHDIHRDIGIY